MKHLLYSSLDFKDNLKWLKEVLDKNPTVSEVSHKSKKSNNKTFYTTIVFRQ